MFISVDNSAPPPEIARIIQQQATFKYFWRDSSIYFYDNISWDSLKNLHENKTLLFLYIFFMRTLTVLNKYKVLR